MKKLIEIQAKLKAPKSQTNAFGKYKYRSCEDILEAVKPLLNGALLVLTDEIVEVGGRVYVKAMASITDGVQGVQVFAYARESETKKGMDDSQITGSASSYARKYALNGLFLIDDTKDADTMDNSNASTEFISDTEKGVILDYINSKEVNIPAFVKYMKIESIEKMPKSKYNQAIKALEAK